MSRELFVRLGDAYARINKLISLAGAIADGYAASDDLRDFLDMVEQGDIDLEPLFGTVPGWVAEEIDGGDTEALYGWLIDTGKFGFLVEFAAAALEWRDETYASIHWGIYSTSWVYAETFEGAIEKGFAWVQERRQKERAKVGAKPRRKGEAKA